MIISPSNILSSLLSLCCFHNQVLKSVSGIYEISAFIQPVFKSKVLEITPGFRYTSNEIIGDNKSFRLSAVIMPNKNQAIKLIYGESYRSPNLLELYFDHPTIIGNPNLKPENSQSFEFVFQKKSKHVYMLLNPYYARYQNLIQRIRPDESKPANYLNLQFSEEGGVHTSFIMVWKPS